MENITTNKKAHFEYFILKKFEAGISLVGCEVKSIRNGEVNLRDSFVTVRNGEAFLHNMFIKTYEKTGNYQPEERRTRKLLLHKEEITKLTSQTAEKGLTLIPLRLYFNKQKVKVEIALCRGKLLHDKRETIKKRDLEKSIRRDLKNK